MNIKSFKNEPITVLKEMDIHNRIIGYVFINNVQLIGRNFHYPNVLCHKMDTNCVISPYDETIMSLNKSSFYDNNMYNDNIKELTNPIIIKEPLFFFIYNIDNYYHFLYDTLPYLYTYLELKKQFPTLKLLINYPTEDKKEFYKFNTEFLNKLINEKDIIIHTKNNIYNKLFISTSLTHGGLSNSPPRKEIYTIYDTLKQHINMNNINDKYKSSDYKNMYISRRTWLNKDTSNIGTDYTSRRTMVNETELVLYLQQYNFKEVFAENLNTDEKIYLFSNANKICGSIGGGMSNLLFSSHKTKSYVIVSPYFLDINYRFRYSLNHTDIEYYNQTEVYKNPKSTHSLYIRVKITNNNSPYFNKIGEITEFVENVTNNPYKISLSNNNVAGFNNNTIFETVFVNIEDFEPLDNGLNSPYCFNFKNTNI